MPMQGNFAVYPLLLHVRFVVYIQLRHPVVSLQQLCRLCVWPKHHGTSIAGVACDMFTCAVVVCAYIQGCQSAKLLAPKSSATDNFGTTPLNYNYILYFLD